MVIKHDSHDYVEKFGDYRQELISLMPWIGPNVTKEIADGGMM